MLLRLETYVSAQCKMKLMSRLTLRARNEEASHAQASGKSLREPHVDVCARALMVPTAYTQREHADRDQHEACGQHES